MAKTWSEIVEEKARTFALAAKLNAAVKSDAVACEWHATTLREMARILDRDARERARILGGFRLFGFRLTLSRVEAGK